MKKIIDFDYSVALFFQEKFSQKWLQYFFLIITHLGDFGFIWFFFASIFWFWGQKNLGNILFVGLVTVVILGEGIIKNIFRRKRPFVAYEKIFSGMKKSPKSFSFPSGHTAISWTAVTILCGKMGFSGFVIFCILLAVCISFSRIFLRVHYFSDVIVGMVFSIWVGILTLFLEKIIS